MRRAVLLQFFVLVLALTLDHPVFSVIFGGVAQSLFVPAVVILAGLRRGSVWGLGAGWAGAFLVASFTTEPLGMAMLRLAIDCQVRPDFAWPGQAWLTFPAQVCFPEL